MVDDPDERSTENRANPNRFVVLPGHEEELDVVENGVDYVVVER